MQFGGLYRMNPEQIEIITALARCRFLPGTWDKRFIREMASRDRARELTEAQNEWIYRLLYKYRRQAPVVYKYYHKHPLCRKKPPTLKSQVPSPPPPMPPPPTKVPIVTQIQTNLNL